MRRGNKPRFTPEQEAHIASLAGDRTALRAAYPDVPTSTLRSILTRHAAPLIRKPWPAEDQIVRDLYPNYAAILERLPHRSIHALRQRARILGLSTGLRRNGGGRKLTWTPEQIEAAKIRGNSRNVPGKTQLQVKQFRQRQGIRVGWLERGEARLAREARRAAKTAGRQREQQHVEAMARLRAAPARTEPGADLFRAMANHFRNNDPERQDDLIAEAMLAIMTGEATTHAEAAKLAYAAHGRFTRKRDLHISWDERPNRNGSYTYADVISAERCMV